MMNRFNRRGFTLVELLVVIAILAVISSMVVGLFTSATERAAATVSMATQKQLLNQANAFMQMHDGKLADGFDSLLLTGTTGAYTALGTYSPAGEGTPTLNIATSSEVNLRLFFPQTYSTGAAGAFVDPKNINRGLDLDSYLGENRVLTVKQITLDDVRLITSLGVTNLLDFNPAILAYSEPPVTSRAIAVNGGIALIDPQGIAGQKLYQDFGIDLSDTTVFPRKGTDDAATTWDDSIELSDAGRLAAFKRQMFYVLGVGLSSKMLGDRLGGLQEAPASSVVSQGFYNRYSLVIKKGGLSSGDRNAAVVGVLDPKGRGATAARQAVNAIR